MKYINNSCCICEKCNNNLFGLEVVENPNHIYSIGQLFSCRCKSSSLWTNSIRNVKNLVNYLNKSSDNIPKNY